MTAPVLALIERLRDMARLADEIERLASALRRISSLEEKNVPKYAQQIAREALDALKDDS